MTVTNNIENRVRLAEFNPVSPTTVFPLDYPVYAADDLTALKNDFEVTLNGALTTGYTFTATFVDGVATDAALNFSPGITGNLQVASLRAPRSILDVPTGRGFTSGELQSGFNATLASARDTFDLALEQRASLLALAAIISSGGATMPPLLQSLTMGALSTLGAGILSVIVMAWDSNTPVGPESYVRVGSAPTHALKFRSQDRYLADGITIDNANGGWWSIAPGPEGVDARAGGVRFDSNPTGSIGVDNTVAMQRVVDAGFPVRLAYGYAAFDGQLTVHNLQAIVGRAMGDGSLTSNAGSALVYRGTGARSGGPNDANECFISSVPGSAFVGSTQWSNFSIIGTAANTATWLVRLYTVRNFRADNVRFRNNAQALVWDSKGGDEIGTTNTYVNGGGLILPSCLQSVKNTRADISWQYYFSGCDFLCAADSSVSHPDEDKYLGYPFALDLDGNDIYIGNKCHFNGCAVMGRYGGGIVSDRTTNWENISLGGDSGRAAVILRNKGGAVVDNGILTIGGSINGQINSAGIGVVIDASYNTGIADCTVNISAAFRTSVQNDVELRGNSTFRASGGSMHGSSFFDGDLTEPKINIVSTWRGVPVTWRGFKTAANDRVVPDHWINDSPLRMSWRAAMNSVAPNTIIATGAPPPVIVGTPTGEIYTTTNYLTVISPRTTVLSAAGAGSAAEVYGDQFWCARGDAVNKGGYFWQCMFGFKTLTVTARGFIGLQSSLGGLPNANPSILLQCFGIGFDASGATLNVIRGGGSSPATPDDLGAGFPVLANIPYIVSLWTAPFGNTYFVRVERPDTKQNVMRAYAANTQVPGQTARLVPHVWLNNGTTASPVELAFAYAEMRPFVNDIFGGNV